MTNRRAHRWLTALAMAQAFTAQAAAPSPSLPCVPALSVTDVEHGFRFEQDCGIEPAQRDRFAADAWRAARRAHLPGRQRVAFAKAADWMFETNRGQPFSTLAPIVLTFAAQGEGGDDVDFAALARDWDERYALLRRQTRIMWTDDPLEPQVDAAVAALDLDGAAKLIGAELAEPGAPNDLIAARSFEAGIVESLRFSWKRALTFVRIAHVLRPDDLRIADFYGDLLVHARSLELAQPVYESLVLHYQVLAHDKPDRWRPPFARALAKLGHLYSGLALPADAEMADLHALGLYWGLAREQPARFAPAVADLLEALGSLYRDAARPSDAIDAYREALKLERALAQRDAGTYTPDLATTLNDLGVLYAMQHQAGEARDAYTEALALQRALVRENALAYRPALAQTLNNLGNLYSDGGQLAEAERAYDEALAIRRKLARESPAHDAPDMARTLTNLGVLYRKQGRTVSAEHAYREALLTLAPFERAGPGAVGADRARTLNNLGVLLSKTRRRREAEDAYRRAIALYHALAKKEPETYRGDYARVLGNLAKLYDEMGRKREAQAVLQTAAKLRQDATEAQ
ncbi:tetratricopeptide repeat protein [Trinickia sp.]|uniref:tetratricopeptide repeat protein n=1 Tax=Trinickia sp. TaxID=2571163 RepID=UPI003F80D99A